MRIGTCDGRRVLLAGLFLALLLALGARPGAGAVDGCPVFPYDHIWNTRIDKLPVDARSAQYINSIGPSTGLHPDFGAGQWEGAPIGIPYTAVPGTQNPVAIHWTAYGSQSDPGPYPVPADAPVEGAPNTDGDRHVLVVDRDRCRLYELYRAFLLNDGSWNADSGAVYDLRAYQLRPDTWTSADAAGLPIFPGLARLSEVAAGEIKHALRFTASPTQKMHVWPARHDASSNINTAYPPMGQRFRLKASFVTTGFSPQVRVLLEAMKTFGLILADNGSIWYVSGAPDPGWDDDRLVNELRNVHGADFEAVDESSLMIDPNSGQARQPFYTIQVPLLVK